MDTNIINKEILKYAFRIDFLLRYLIDINYARLEVNNKYGEKEINYNKINDKSFGNDRFELSRQTHNLDKRISNKFDFIKDLYQSNERSDFTELKEVDTKLQDTLKKTGISLKGLDKLDFKEEINHFTIEYKKLQKSSNNNTKPPINRSLIRQQDYHSQLSVYCCTVSEYNGAQVIGLTNNKSNQEIVNIIEDLGKNGYFSATTLGNRIYGENAIDYKGDAVSQLTSANVENKLKNLGNDSFAVLKFLQKDYYGAQRDPALTDHWITYVHGEYIDSNDGKRSKKLSDLGAGTADLSKLKDGYIYDKHKNKDNK